MFFVRLKWTLKIQSYSKGFKLRQISSLELKKMWDNPEEKSKVSRSLINEYFKSQLNLPLPTDIIPPPLSYSLKEELQDWLKRIESFANGHIQSLEFQYNKLEWHVYILTNLYNLNSNDCLSILQKMESSDIKPDLSILELMIQSILVKDGIPKCMEFIESSYHLHYQHLTMNILVMLSQAAIRLGDIDLHNRFFTILRKNWWPISRNAYTYLFAAHIDLLIAIEHIGVPKSSSDILSKTTPKNIFQSLKWSLKHQSMLRMRMDAEQYHIIIMGLAQGGFLEKALEYYYWYIAYNRKPTSAMLDVMMCNICQLKPGYLINSVVFGQPTNATTVQQYLFQQYQKYDLTPSITAFASMLLFLNKTDKKAFKLIFEMSQKEPSQTLKKFCNDIYEALDAGNTLPKNTLYILRKDRIWSLKSTAPSPFHDSVLWSIPESIQTLSSASIYSKNNCLSKENIDLKKSIIDVGQLRRIRGAKKPTSLRKIQYYMKSS